MDTNQEKKISTSALAKSLGIPPQQLFSTLKDYSWIRKLDEGWELTSKGEFEGGEYRHSKKFGRYIVWPEVLAEHPLLQALEDSRYISATTLGKQYGLNARQINRILAELAWLKHSFQGWELTTLGERHKGVQLENESSGTFYVVWPEAVQQDSVLSEQLRLSSEIAAGVVSLDDDFFTLRECCTALDGHQHKSCAHLQVCHWLYMAGIAHACKRRLAMQESLFADFYIPAHQLYVECWGGENSAELAKKMKRKDYYQQQGHTVLDIESDDFKNLDEVLTRQFRKLGIRVI